MSRHVLSRKRGNGFIVVGYDRPLKEFFIQVWSKRGNHMQTDTFASTEEVGQAIPCVCDKVPEGLLEQLAAEERGSADTNTCKDWRRGAA